jgi:hypothetical protein
MKTPLTLAISATAALLLTAAAPSHAQYGSIRYAGPGYPAPIYTSPGLVIAPSPWVAPPFGTVVPTLPPNGQYVYYNRNPFYYYNGAYLAPGPGGYQMVAPPIGITVPYYPYGATRVVVNNGIYFRSGGIYYQPYMSYGRTVYRTVRF